MTAVNPTVLIVEDESDLAALYAHYLSDHYTVKTANSGEEALKLFDGTVDVVLLDRKMPGLSGDEVLREVSRRGYDCRVAMVTAVTPQSDIVDFGIEDYLVKRCDCDPRGTRSGVRRAIDETSGTRDRTRLDHVGEQRSVSTTERPVE
jgi:DNA-binding response OmpR family regulator